jgi:hypothetical protein
MNRRSMGGNNPKKTRPAVRVSATLEKRLLVYAVSASAAGASLLAMVRPAEAKIVYTPAHKKLPLNRDFSLDLNHDGISDFKFLLSSRPVSGRSFRVGLAAFPAPPHSANGIVGSTNVVGGPCAAALIKGTKIGMTNQFVQARVYMFAGTPSGSYCSWRNAIAYLGLKFSIKGKVHFGWARFVTDSRPVPPRAELTGFAYETIPGKAIVAGATKGLEDAEQPDRASRNTHSSKPATLGALALGVPGLDIWRRE